MFNPNITIMKKLITIIALGAAMLSASAAMEFDLQELSDITSITLTNTSSSNVTARPYQLNGGTNVGVQLVATPVNAGTSNLWFVLKFSMDKTNYFDTTTSVTNALTGSNLTIRAYSTIAVPTHARWVKVVSAQTQQTNRVALAVRFGQFR